MSEYITHIAVQEDVARLALHAKSICDAFKICMKSHNLAMRIGSASRGNSTFIIQNIDHFRSTWERRKPEDRLEDKLAYTLGWITHRAADRYFKAKYGIFDKNPENLHPVDIRILHDVVLYDKVYSNGVNKPFTKGFAQTEMKGHPAAKFVDITQAEAITGPMYQANFLNLQSIEKASNAKEFFDRVEKQFATFTVDFDRLVEGVNDPDPEDMHQMIEAPNFYNEEDTLIKLARNIQQGKSTEGLQLENALKEENLSQYAQVLKKAFNWLFEASQYFNYETKTTIDEMYDKFNINNNQRVDRY